LGLTEENPGKLSAGIEDRPAGIPTSRRGPEFDELERVTAAGGEVLGAWAGL
jgi:hypothetical protein